MQMEKVFGKLTLPIMNWKQLFPQFEPELIELIEKNAVERVIQCR